MSVHLTLDRAVQAAARHLVEAELTLHRPGPLRSAEAQRAVVWALVDLVHEQFGLTRSPDYLRESLANLVDETPGETAGVRGAHLVDQMRAVLQDLLPGPDAPGPGQVLGVDWPPRARRLSVYGRGEAPDGRRARDPHDRHDR